MAESPPSDIDLLLLGKTGNGKSSCGNTILGRNEFKVVDSLTSGTDAVSSAWARREGCVVKVVDGPGLVDTKLSGIQRLEATNANLRHGFVECSNGFHALLLVLRYAEPYSKEEQYVVDVLRNLLGKDVIKKHCILVFTHCEYFESAVARGSYQEFDDWCDVQTGELGDLIKECDNRVVPFYKSTEKKRKEPVSRLFGFVETISSRYTCKEFNSLKAKRQTFIEKTGALQLKEVIQSEINLILSVLSSDLSQLNGATLETMLKRLENEIDKEKPDLKVSKQVKLGIKQARNKDLNLAEATFKDIEYKGISLFQELLEFLRSFFLRQK